MTRTIKIIAVIIAFILINIVSGIFSARLDFTEGQIYTLSPSTAKIISKIQDPIEIKVFLSEKLPPQIMSLRQLIVDKLNDYKSLSNGKIKLSFVDPAKDEEGGKLAKALNIPALDLQVIEQDQMQVLKTYIGLAILKPKKDYKDDGKGDPLAKYEKTEAMPVIQDVNKLEYDLAALLLKASSDKQKTIGFLTGHGEHQFTLPPEFAQMQGMGGNRRADYDVNRQLEKTYQLTAVDLNQPAPPAAEKAKTAPAKETAPTQEIKNPLNDVTTLVVAGPTTEIPKDQAQKIYDFVSKGGNAVFLLDTMQLGMPFSMTASAINTNQNLLEPWGLQIEPKLIADTNSGTATFSQGFMTYMLPYPLFVNASNLNKENPITRDLQSFILPWTSPIKITPKDGIKIDTLATTSDTYSILEETKTTPPAPAQTAAGTQQTAPLPQTEPINIDPQQKFSIPGQSKPTLPLAVIAQKNGEGKILAVPNSIFIAQSFPNRTNANMAFFFNAVDSLSLGDDLIQIRSKGITERPIAKIDQLQKDTIQWGLTFGLPLIFIIFGILRRGLRNAKKKQMTPN